MRICAAAGRRACCSHAIAFFCAPHSDLPLLAVPPRRPRRASNGFVSPSPFAATREGLFHGRVTVPVTVRTVRMASPGDRYLDISTSDTPARMFPTTGWNSMVLLAGILI